jgi:hypothetical protein
MNLWHACIAVLGWLFWRLVALNAGPKHPAYLHAIWRAHVNRLAVRASLGAEQ